MHHTLMILVVAVITAALRLLPVMFFGRESRVIPPSLMYLSRVLPSAIVSLLVIYSLRSMSFIILSSWLPAISGVIMAALLHQWKRNTLLSVFGSTACYMLLTRML
jgi:branched-subunit amino acid transport protein AzlD